MCDDRAFFIGVIRRRPVAYIFYSHVHTEVET
nr:MAG TPA_asm: hypothetical protein [Caudoviricetes sp.]